MKFRNLVSPIALTVAGALVFATAGCACTSPPTVQMTVAMASVEAANGAGAQAYAPTEMRQANDKLVIARRAMAVQDHDLALRFSQQAHVDAQLAIAKTRAIKARAAAEGARLAARDQREDLERKVDRMISGGSR